MSFVTWVAEQFGGTSLRVSWRALSSTFFPDRPLYDKTRVTRDLARQLYRNDGDDTKLGGGVCRPIIDRTVEFMGIPTVATGDVARDQRLNTAIQTFWKGELIQVFRDALRDSDCVVHLWQPRLTNPLVTESEREACKLAIYPRERVTVTYDPNDPMLITEAVIVHWWDYRDTDTQAQTDPARGAKTQHKEHEIWQIITPNNVRYYDRTRGAWIDTWQMDNIYGFVPIIEVFNEYDSSLSGGQSDLESVYPFVKAFHEVFLHTLRSHRYHSMPKLKFNVKNMEAFLSNNFPDTIDPTTKRVIPGSTIKWQGKEVLFLNPDEDMSFIEAQAVLGDSKLLLEFLVDCISMAAQVPEEMFMRTETGAGGGSDRKLLAFERRIERKRIVFQSFIQMLCKTSEAMNDRVPETPQVLWEEIRMETLRDMAQAIQQVTMSLEVLLERKLISDNTGRSMLSMFRMFRRMKPPEQEAAEAESNFLLGAEQMKHEKEMAASAAKAAEATAKASPNGGGGRTPARSGRNGGGANE